MDLQRFIIEEVKRALNEIYKRPDNGILELGANAVSKKLKYAKRAWALIQKCYEYIGGCKSFESVNGDDGFTDFVHGEYVWRIFFGDSSNDIKGIMVYKPTEFGRKRICSASVNKEIYNKMMEKDFYKSTHAYSEVSGKAEHQLGKDPRTNWLSNQEAAKVLRGKKIYTQPDAEINDKEFDPYVPDSHYYRDISNEKHRKRMFGHPML